MKTLNHEVYVSLEIAKLLKEAGFDWEVNTCRYNSSSDKVISNGTLISNFNGYPFQHIAISSPTLDVAQRWLREIHDVHILIDCIAAKRWEITLQYFNGNDIKIEDNEPTYEKAQEAGIKKALEIILEKRIRI